jgi:hypothetical protein
LAKNAFGVLYAKVSSQVWLVVRTDSPVDPIVPSGDVNIDIEATRAKVQDMKVLCKSGTCLDPRLFNLEGAGAHPLDSLPPSTTWLGCVSREAEATLLDVPDASWLCKISRQDQVIGPLTEMQLMAVAFVRINRNFWTIQQFFAKFWSSGAYLNW